MSWFADACDDPWKHNFSTAVASHHSDNVSAVRSVCDCVCVPAVCVAVVRHASTAVCGVPCLRAGSAMDLGTSCSALTSLEASPAVSAAEDGGTTCMTVEMAVGPVTPDARTALVAEGRLPDFSRPMLLARLGAAAEVPGSALDSVSDGAPRAVSRRSLTIARDWRLSVKCMTGELRTTCRCVVVIPRPPGWLTE